MLLKRQEFSDQLCESKGLNVTAGLLIHSQSVLSCRHTLSVKGLVWQRTSQGSSWIKGTHITLLLLVVSFLFLCIACGRLLPE